MEKLTRRNGLKRRQESQFMQKSQIYFTSQKNFYI